VAAVVLGVVLTLSMVATTWPSVVGLQETDTRDLALTMFKSYVLPFEVVSVLLLAAVIGGVFLAKRERGGND
jgi:NADH-quinone oxidoreductase subunit J